MIFDRQYNQYDQQTQSFNGLKVLLIANTVAYVLQIVFSTFDQELWFRIVELSGAQILHFRIWTLFSYSLAHGGFMHFGLNMLILFIFGREVQRQLGGQRLIMIYIVGVLLGGSLWLIFNFGQGIVIGASAGITGIVCVFCLFNYNQRMNLLLFFFIPATLTGKHMLLFILGMEGFGFLFGEVMGLRGMQTGIAYSAHLGGMLGGFIIFRNVHLLDRLIGWIQKPRIQKPGWMDKNVKTSSKDLPFTLNLSSKGDVRREVDRILDKISEKGFASLSEEEKKILNQAKDLMRR